MLQLSRPRIVFFGFLAAWPMFGDPPATPAPPPVPAVIIPATSDQATATVHLSGIDQPQAQDLQVTVPPSDDRVAPTVTITGVTGAAKDWDVALKAEQLTSFGETLATLSYKGQPERIVRFLKPGLVVKTPDGRLTAKEGCWYAAGTPLTIVLENPAAAAYPVVRARFRFADTDVCEATTDKTHSKLGDNSKCNDPAQWASFPVTRFTSTTLRAMGAKSWFRDSQTGYPKSAKRKGTLTLRYDGPGGGTALTVYEQNIPLEVQLDPSSWSMFGTLLEIAAWLLVGALLSLILRVTIPNYRRKRAIKEQFAQAVKATRGISDAVNSLLRVLLRVELLALESSLHGAWIGGPGFADVAKRVEQGLATTKRKIDFAKRLDAALNRQTGLAEQEAPPTRLDSIARHMAAATDALLRDQLGEQDWVFIQQHLEAVDKLLGEPTQEEKDAFEALLVQRWKSIRDFFRRDADGSLIVPPVLMEMKECFPSAKCLPDPKDDPDGNQWVKNLTRADIQLSALALVREFLSLLPSTGLAKEPWSSVNERLTFYLQAPGIQTLAAARLLIRELEQHINTSRIVEALQARQADIEVDPQTVSRNEKTRLFIRFRDPVLNPAAARLDVECQWDLEDRPATRHREWLKGWLRPGTPPTVQPATRISERGWEIYHYFGDNVTSSDITVRFYWSGKLLPWPVEGQPDPPPLEYKRTVYPGAQLVSSDRWWRFYRNEKFQRVLPEALQLAAALLVPLAALAVTQTGQANSGPWWDLIGIGFGSETIRDILTGTPEQSGAPAQQPPTK
jgi:hypothetical protein